MIYLEDAIKKFSQLPVLIQAVFNEPETIAKLQYFEEKYKISLVSLLVYTAINEVSDVKEFLVADQSLNQEKAKLIAGEVETEILTPLLERLNFLSDDAEKNYSLAQERHYALDLFEKSLGGLLRGETIINEAINLRLFYLLAKDFDFNKNLENAIFENKEKITTKEFILEGKAHSGSVSNWLKDFIKANGSENFDSVSLSHFIANSTNAKKLNQEEKDLVRKLLLTYRNLKFFPESMADMPVEQWEIIPVEKMNVTPEKRVKREGDRLDELKEIASQYPEGSLERKAIEEEIKKFK